MSAPSPQPGARPGAVLPESVQRGAAVHVRGLSLAYGDRPVLRGVDLDVAPGELVAVVGPSGGGKTTLLRVLAGLAEPDGGRVEVRHGAARGRVRVMFQEDRLLPWQSVRENVALGLPREERRHADAALAGVGLADRADEHPHVLSGGQRQRVALARALAHRPALLLLDEPFGALDALTRAGMHALLEDLWRDSGLTALLVTHDVDEAVRLGDRVVVLQDGRLTEDIRVERGRPRRRGDPALLAVREKLEERLLGEGR